MIARILLALLLLLPPPLWASSTTINATTTELEVASVAAIQGTTFSIGCWAYRAGHGENTLSIIYSKGGDTGTDGWFVYDENAANTQLRFSARYDDTNGIWRINRPSDSTWFHWMFTYTWTVAGGAPVGYIDGAAVTVTQVTAPIGNANGTGQPLTIGNRPDAAFTWNGRLANCVFYNRILTANEVKASMRCPKNVTNGLIGFWPLGVFGGRNYTSTASLALTETDTAVSATGPPVNCPQGSSRGLRWR